jgi:hypothetical protein
MRTSPRPRPAFRVAALVRQITTGPVCHLDAEMIDGALRDWDLASLDWEHAGGRPAFISTGSSDFGLAPAYPLESPKTQYK